MVDGTFASREHEDENPAAVTACEIEDRPLEIGKTNWRATFSLLFGTAAGLAMICGAARAVALLGIGL